MQTNNATRNNLNTASSSGCSTTATGSMGCLGNPTADDLFAALNNIRHGNNPPPARALAQNNTCTYCSGKGHWRSNCPVFRRDAFLPPPQDPSRSVSTYA
ncbi:uncharacterized protein VP01_2371g6 [Puccinia sorghi]|uniref:CCHC-type domain-containing protein n=1 Tax=Puccinia sorghi TaxID=27349 RepID=A0A0L6V783_9BASI|nr:uncharacterized protein VP01_2371g6 [Puccinia sorghi]